MQNWNILLKYIKNHLGAPFAMLEMNDSEIQDYIIENCLPEISAFDSDETYCKVTASDKYSLIKPNLSDHDRIIEKYQYIIPIPSDITILDVYEVYKTSSNTILSGMLTQSTYMITNPANVVMSNQLQSMANSLKTIETYTFIRPNIIIFNYELTDYVILHCKTMYNDLNRMPSDTWHEIFKKKCLAEIKLILVSKRSKFENLETPFQTININWDKIENDANTILNDIESKLDSFPPDNIMTWM